jgi:CubicO group peptidase (beta-lactamase class C family)
LITTLRDILEPYVEDGTVPGAVGLLAHGDRDEVAAIGSSDVHGTATMARESIFRIASLTKPVTAAAVMMLVEDGRIGLHARSGRGCPSWRPPSWSAHRRARSRTSYRRGGR